MFEDAGCRGEALTAEPVKGSREPNVICTHPGVKSSRIIVGAHFDKVEAGDGVVDNWSGASLLPSFYQGLLETQRQHALQFIGFTGEEVGLLGSKAFVKSEGKDLRNITAMVNLDTLGLAETEIWASHADRELVRWFIAVAKTMNLPVSIMNVDQVGSTDSESFREHKVPAMTIHSLTRETMTIFHSPRDQFTAVKMDEYYRSYQLVLGFLAFIDQKLD